MLPTNDRRLKALMVGILVAAVPARSEACWLFDCFGHHNRTTFYAPAAVAAPACNTCAPQTVSYVPQTAYRPLLTTTPVVALRPVMATDPCTGCSTTVMQPATSYVQRTVMMPYTTYRPVIRTSYYAPAVAAPVMAAPSCSTGACAPAATTTYYQPAAVAPAVTQPGCCAANSGPAGFSPVSTITSSPTVGPATYAPSLPAAPAAQPNNGASESPSDKTFKQAPETKENSTNGEAMSFPRLTDPMNRTTSNALPARAYTPVAWKAMRMPAVTSRVEKLGDSGWEAAR
jgi:hypothetical protein